MEDKKVKILNKTVTGTDRSLMLVEDTILGRLNVAIAPKDYKPGEGEFISKTRDVHYVFPKMQEMDKAMKMYEKLKQESR